VLARITGQLVSVAQGRAQIGIGPMIVDVLVPGSDVDALTRCQGQQVEFHTMLVLEGVGQGSSMIPRLLGFASAGDRAFFELFTTVKNIGHRKALRALQMPAADIAAAIARRDIATLVSLPEIGKRTAETIIAELSGKVEPYLDGQTPASFTGDSAVSSMLSDAIAMLVALGERPDTARQLAERSMSGNPELDSPEALLAHIMSSR
jgi:Holliday junction DNA helicase RuvA